MAVVKSTEVAVAVPPLPTTKLTTRTVNRRLGERGRNAAARRGPVRRVERISALVAIRPISRRGARRRWPGGDRRAAGSRLCRWRALGRAPDRYGAPGAPGVRPPRLDSDERRCSAPGKGPARQSLPRHSGPRHSGCGAGSAPEQPVHLGESALLGGDDLLREGFWPRGSARRRARSAPSGSRLGGARSSSAGRPGRTRLAHRPRRIGDSPASDAARPDPAPPGRNCAGQPEEPPLTAESMTPSRCWFRQGWVRRAVECFGGP
jgi:hypothetical protein